MNAPKTHVESQTLFTKGHLRLTLNDHVLEFLYQLISIYGVSGLPANPLTKPFFGQKVFLTLEVPSAKPPLIFKTQAKVLREQTITSEHMSLKFELDANQKAQLLGHISKKGFYPTAYVRKYPRIPSSSVIQTFPLRAIIKPLDQTRPIGPKQLIMDVINLSPNGILLSTDSQIALDLAPGQRLGLELEPRGWFPVSVHVEGLICRVTDDLMSETGNLSRQFGIKFTKVDAINRAAFLDLLKDILEQIQGKMTVNSAESTPEITEDELPPAS